MNYETVLFDFRIKIIFINRLCDIIMFTFYKLTIFYIYIYIYIYIYTYMKDIIF